MTTELQNDVRIAPPASNGTLAKPRVSVVMPVHNTARYVTEAIQSVLNQELCDLELILIDDGSTDDSLDRIRSVSDRRIVILRNATAGGPSRARNQGIKAAKAPYVAFLDSDDVMCVDSMLSAVQALDAAPTAVIAFGDLRRIDLESRELVASVLADYPCLQQLQKRPLKGSWHLIASQDFGRGLLDENFIGTGSVVVRAQALERSGVFDEQLFNSEDRDLWFRLSRQGDALFSNAIRYSYRLNPASISYQPGERNARNRILVLQRERLHWVDRDALRQIDRLIAENHAAMGYARREEGRRFAAAASFFAAFRITPRWFFLKALVGGLLGRGA